MSIHIEINTDNLNTDWSEMNENDLKPINPVLRRLMIALDIERIDDLIQPGILHFKLM